MGAASKAGDLIFKAFVGGLGVTTIYLTATFSVNVYRGLSWHKAQSLKSSASCSAGYWPLLENHAVQCARQSSRTEVPAVT
ncbi:hypothetical protein KY290_028905 [Solanum tuberosum]|uniref:Uncharacterized protein n=1 Tax=Solanum tuberosum TaxID=4113 RepID=A0ABQ7UJ85_SOLTU|nr:hypothetical protein KY284_027894 [Solanum tuberosum]KAH0666728.1 hypothetical protein KY285_027934 [Solanum tuberosum]KAH0749673.1 hypothetical protein KY290_028905 [Solanum tuberosum]